MGESEYSRGELVRHSKLNYRGAVMEIFLEGDPQDEWQRSKSFIESEEPWYRILVDGERGTRLAAESELVSDSAGGVVKNPRVDDVFEGFDEGRYFPRVL